MNKENIKILIGACLAASITWYINHNMGYGPIVANGLIGVIVAIFVSPKLSGIYYLASFVGMSGMGVLPSMVSAGIGGLLVGTVVIFSPEVYGGMGGKGGTMAAFSTQVVRGVIQFFV